MGWTQVLFVSCATIFIIFGLTLGAPLSRKESLDNIGSLKNKLDELKSVLRGLENDVSVKEARQVEAPQDELLAKFESQLTEADKQLVEKMKSKVHYLQDALHEPLHPDESDQDNVAQEKRGQADVNDPQLRELLARLSPEDLKLIKAHSSKLDALKTALSSKSVADVKQPKETTVKEREAEILEAIKSKLVELKKSMVKDEKCKCDEMRCECDDSPKAVITEGKFGNFVAKDQNNNVEKELVDTKGSWMQAPVDDTVPVNVNEKCKDYENCQTPPEDNKDKKCKDDENCQTPPEDHKEMVDSVKQRLLADLDMARKNGVSTKELLDALTAKRGI